MTARTLLLTVALIAFGGSARADVVKAGTWHAVAHAGTGGGWQIVIDNGAAYVEMTKDFATEKAPDLKIFLSPRKSSELDGDNATKGSLRVAKLTSHRGAARYALPRGVDLAKYKSIVLQCEQYAVLFAKSAL